MKKLALAIPLLALCNAVIAQTYTERFSSSPFTGDVPSNMVQIKNNNLTYAGSLFSGSNNSKGFIVGVLNSDTVAISSSHFTPAGRSDNWLITPPISGINAYSYLAWEDLSSNAQNKDSIEVRISTSSNPNPTPADFTTVFYSKTEAGYNGAFAYHAISLAAYAYQTVRIAFHHISTDGDLLYLDDVMVNDMIIQRDIAVNKTHFPKYYDPSTSATTIAATVQSLGSQNVTSFRMNYQVGTGSVVSQTFNKVLGYYDTAKVTFSQATSITANTDVKIWVDQINGTTDLNNANDTLIKPAFFIANKPPKNVLLEDATGSWCSSCPLGWSYMKQIINSNPGTVGMSYHDGDAMMNFEATGISRTYLWGFPIGMIDRTIVTSAQRSIGVNDDEWPTLVTIRKKQPVPVQVSVSNKSFDATTRQVSVTVKADFVSDVKGNFRLNAVLLEDSVYNTVDVTGWSQANYFNGQSSSEWYQKGNPMVGYRHNHVVAAMLGGVWGDSTTIPATVTSGQSFTKTFTFTLPAKQVPASGGISHWNEDNMRIVAYVAEHDVDDINNRPVLNSDEAKLLGATGIQTIVSAISNTKVYPNPAQNNATLSINLNKAEEVGVTLADITGRIVYEVAPATMNAGANHVNIPTANLANGIYTIKVITKDGSVTERLSVIR